MHFKLSVLVDEKSDKEIEEYMKKAQPFFLFLKQMGDNSEDWISGSTKRVLEYYTKEEQKEVFNKLDELHKTEGSKLGNYIYVK
jgi:hypothetical protein